MAKPPFRQWRLIHRIKIAQRCNDGAALAHLAYELAKLRQRILVAAITGAAILAFALPAFGQTPTPAPTTLPSNFYGIGAGYNGSASPEVAGTAVYGRLLSQSSGTYAATVFDALPVSNHPFTVDTAIGVGIVQKVFSMGKVPVYVPSTAGIAWSGHNMGWKYDFGVLLPVKVYDSYGVALMVRGQKDNIANGAGLQPIVSVLFTFGK